MGNREENQQDFTRQDQRDDSGPSRFDLLPDANAANVGRLSIFRRMRQVFRRRDSQADDADAFFDDKLDSYLD